jgi:hypothetical protein
MSPTPLSGLINTTGFPHNNDWGGEASLIAAVSGIPPATPLCDSLPPCRVNLHSCPPPPPKRQPPTSPTLPEEFPALPFKLGSVANGVGAAGWGDVVWGGSVGWCGVR